MLPSVAEVQRSSVSWTRDEQLRSSPLVKATRRCRTLHADVRHATSRDCLRSPRVLRVPIRAAARGEARRTRRHRGLRRRRGASPECSVSAGLHPSPGTVHPRRHQAGGGVGENIGTPQVLAQMKMERRTIEKSFPLVRARLWLFFPRMTRSKAISAGIRAHSPSSGGSGRPGENGVRQAGMAKATAAAAAVLSAISSTAHPFTAATVAPTKGNSAGSLARPR